MELSFYLSKISHSINSHINLNIKHEWQLDSEQLKVVMNS